MTQPLSAYALTSGPSQPEFNSFTPIGTSNMVNLSTGDFNYNIPIMDVGGYPLNLSYQSGIKMDQEASWVGLGWNLNVGQINRSVRGLPDDFNGDEMIYQNNIKENKTVGAAFNINPQAVGLGDVGLGVSAGIAVQHNNYNGVSFRPSYGVSFTVTENVSVGANLTSSVANGATVSPYIGLSQRNKGANNLSNNGFSANFGVGYNSRQGLTNFNMGISSSIVFKDKINVSGSINRKGGGNISFINNTFTPTKRVSYTNSTLSFATSLGLDVFGFDAEVGMTGFASTQKLKNKTRQAEAYGYNYTHKAGNEDVLDFNREKEGIVSKNTLALPVTNYTYDVFQINGQGIGGNFRPFHGGVGHVYKPLVIDEGNSDSFGGEVEPGVGWHVGVDFTTVDIESNTGKWQSPVANYFTPSPSLNNIDAEQLYYKLVGEPTIDMEIELFTTKLGGKNPIRIGIGGSASSPGKYAENIYVVKTGASAPSGTGSYSNIPIDQPIKRAKRDLRNKAIVPVTFLDAKRDSLFNFWKSNPSAKDHHLAGYKIINTNGSRYIYGETVYNTEKIESTFALNGNHDPNNSNEIKNGIVSYTNENGIGNTGGFDNYYSSVETPAYAHTFLLTSILSADYEDINGNGPSDDDLGSYTKFNYATETTDYNWRVPYLNKKASYNPGLNSRTDDEKGSVVSGSKELKYINTIETKTQVAYFKLKKRLDGKEANGSDHMKHIEKIFLFSKPEYENLLIQFGGNLNNVPSAQLIEKSIKIAHFVYDGDDNDTTDDYDLCPGVPNSTAARGGKLSLKKLYFTYGNSYLGKYSPYKFHYESFNPSYSMKAYNIWGNYKPNHSTNYNVFGNPLTPQEFPYVQQKNKTLQDQYASAWSLTSVDLPSGGTINVSYESDDYQYVQDRKAMRMFKVVGVTKENEIPNAADIGNSTLYKNGNYTNDAKYLIVEIPEPNPITSMDFKNRYLGEHYNNPIYFRFMVNMSKQSASTNNNDFEYVTGYFKIDQDTPIPNTFLDGGKVYGAIPMEFYDLEGGINGNKKINPISKAGWYFGRKHLQRKIYGLPTHTGSVEEIMTQLKSDFAAITEIIAGPNGKLRNEKLIAKRFVPEKSWIRLLVPDGRKLGGGARVTKITMKDNWNNMLTTTNPNYGHKYGQEYTYNLKDGSSSGVATYEPNASKENPFVEPFYHEGDDLVAPRELNYVEKPFGESFFPYPTVTYSRVEVKNLQRTRQIGGKNIVLKKHGVGHTVHEFYTSKDFPTIADYTEIDGPDNYYSNDDNIIGQTLGSLLGLNVEVTSELTLSQGFSVQVNDMNGKSKKQVVYGEYGMPISSVEYKYNLDETGNLDNNLPVVIEDGNIESGQIGVDYEVINDFNESYTYTNTKGLQTNIAVIPITIFTIILPMVVPQSAEHTNILHTVTTTKVIHRTGIMTKKIVTDLGATVSTENLAWDAKTGKVLLTKTINEYNDQYYKMSFPAYWGKKGMGLATNNVGISAFLKVEGGNDFAIVGHNTTDKLLKDLFIEGDELMITSMLPFPSTEKYWVVGFTNSGNSILLMDREGNLVNDQILSPGNLHFFKIVRSGHRNLQNAAMASITLQKNPISDGKINRDDFSVSTLAESKDKKIVNASAVEYRDFWDAPCENGIFPQGPSQYLQKKSSSSDSGQNEPPILNIYEVCINPYLYNIKGDYRPFRSYAYLAGRNNNDIGIGLRKQGFFTQFVPFYIYDSSNAKWRKDFEAVEVEKKWTYASEVTLYSPFGKELENRDALGRYSSAQYGHNYTLPEAVVSNARYGEIGFDSFEDHEDFSTHKELEQHHFRIWQELRQISEEKSHTGKKSIDITSSYGYTYKEVNYNICDTIQCCENCNSFLPFRGEKYTVSAWVMEDNHPGDSLMTYENSRITFEFRDTSGNTIDSAEFLPSGNIIDGWQRIYGEFIIPVNTASFTLHLYGNPSVYCENNSNCTPNCSGPDCTSEPINIYFDDIRFHPYNANMKSYVYDYDTKKLMAELDENNYAAFYEYDKEGNLIRIKKETERGIYTIQESRSGSSKLSHN